MIGRRHKHKYPRRRTAAAKQASAGVESQQSNPVPQPPASSEDENNVNTNSSSAPEDASGTHVRESTAVATETLSPTTRREPRASLTTAQKAIEAQSLCFFEGDVEEGPVLPDITRNLTIAYHFINLHGAPEEEFWGGRNGTMAKIKKELRIPKNTSIKAVLEHIWACDKNGLVYNGRTKLSYEKPGPEPQLKINSPEANIIAEALENGYSISHCMEYVNSWVQSRDSDAPLLTRHAVYSLFKRLNPNIKAMQSISQGSSDPLAKWCRARTYWTTQLLVRLGEADGIDLMKTRESEDGSVEEYLPDYYNIDKLTPIKLSRIAWFDETHRYCQVGGTQGTGLGTKFNITMPRDERGNLDPNGTTTHTNDKKGPMKCKYDKQIRLLLGVATTDDDGNGDDDLVGHRLQPYSYSGKKVVSTKQWDDAVAKQCKDIRDNGKETWITRQTRSRNYHNELLQSKRVEIPLLGKISREKLGLEGIRTIGDLVDLQEEEIQSLCCTVGIAEPRLIEWIRIAKDKCPDRQPLPPLVDHREAENPYLSRYGEGWEEYVKKGEFVRDKVCITDLVQHMYDEARKLFNPENDPEKDDWWIYHDALTQMTAKETKDWMEEKGILKHWILPEQGLYEDEKDLRAYYGRPVGNSPEFMPLDCSLNNDIHKSVNKHCAATCHIRDDDGDPRKFSISTPKRGDRAYFRVLEGCPSSERIVRDCKKVVEHLKKVQEKEGIIIPGLGNRPGRRDGGKPAKRGGYRKRSIDDSFVAKWLHDDAKSAQLEKANMTANEYWQKVAEAEAVEDGQSVTEEEDLSGDEDLWDDEVED